MHAQDVSGLSVHLIIFSQLIEVEKEVFGTFTLQMPCVSLLIIFHDKRIFSKIAFGQSICHLDSLCALMYMYTIWPTAFRSSCTGPVLSHNNIVTSLTGGGFQFYH